MRRPDEHPDEVLIVDSWIPLYDLAPYARRLAVALNEAHAAEKKMGIAVTDVRQLLHDSRTALETSAKTLREAADVVAEGDFEDYLIRAAYDVRSMAQRILDTTGLPSAGVDPVDVGVIAQRITELSMWIDSSYDPALGTELVLRRRLDKITAENGEVADALADWVGENPRKPDQSGSASRVAYELLDVALSALGALEHLNGNTGTSMQLLQAHVAHVHGRAGLGDSDEPQTVSQAVRAEREARHRARPAPGTASAPASS